MFNIEIARLLGRACQYVYDFPDPAWKVLSPDTAGACVTPIFKCNDAGKPPTSFATVLEYGKFNVVAFQGTITRDPDPKVLLRNNLDAVLDWLQNFRALLVTSDGLSFDVPGRVHEGFASQLHIIYPALTAALKDKGIKPLYVTGHSQGGAIAAIAAKALMHDGFPVLATYTFAAPRSGNSVFADSFAADDVHRLEFGDDVVPHVPMRSKLPGVFRTLIGLEGRLVGGKVKEVLERLSDTADVAYQPVGPLTYGRPGMAVLFDVAQKQDEDLAGMRRALLLKAGNALTENHHMYNYLHHLLDVPEDEAKTPA
jgi:hypothetical protein